MLKMIEVEMWIQFDLIQIRYIDRQQIDLMFWGYIVYRTAYKPQDLEYVLIFVT